LNLCAEPHAQVQLGRGTARARSASRHELDRYWPQLTQIWPAYQDFYEEGRPAIGIRARAGRPAL